MSTRITGGTHRGRRLRSVGDVELRPTSERLRGAIFSIIGLNAVKGARVLDLYAGTGALGIEALSRGAAWADFVEENSRLAKRLRENLDQMSLGEWSGVYRASVQKILNKLPGLYDLVLVDPPYAMHAWDNLMINLSDGKLVTDNGVVVVEHRHRTKLSESYGKLVQWTMRRYGDSSLSIYTIGDVNG